MRRLAAVAIAFSTAIFAANYILPAVWLIPCALIAAAIAVLTLIRHRKLPTVALFALAAGFLWFFGHYMLTSVPAKALDGYTGEVTATVTGLPYDGDSYTSVELRIEAEHVPDIKARIYDYSHDMKELKPGQRVSFEVKLRSADTRYGETDPYYNSRDLYLLGTYKSDLRILAEKRFYLPALPAYIGRAVSEKISEIFPPDTAPFMKALLIGDRSDFYDDLSVTTAFSHAGFMHVVAVSGMHIGFLIGFILLVLGRSPRSSVIAIAAIWVFALASGASPSVLRAGFMQTLLLLAPIFRREDDAITTLSFALSVLLMINPYSAASLSLQLSFTAVAGIILFGERINEFLLQIFCVQDRGSFAAYPIGIAASSVSVLILTTPLIALYFGYIQVLGIVTNILGLWAVSLCFCAGLFTCAVGFLLPSVGMLLAKLVSFPARYVLLLVKLIAKIPFSAVYLPKTLLIIWLAVTYTLFVLFIFCRRKPLLKLILPSVISLAILCIMALGVKQWYSGGYYTALDVGQGQCLAAFYGDTTIVVDCGGKSVSENPGTTAGRYLKSHGRTDIDTLIITHAHTDHANGVEQLMELVRVKTLILPPRSKESTMYDTVLDCAVRHNVEVIVLTEDETRTTGDFTLHLIAPEKDAKDNADSLMLLLSHGDYDVLITGDSPAKSERRLVREYGIADVELYMVGHHGSKYSNCDDILESIGAQNAIISVGYNSYGHPTEEVLERLAQYGYNVQRTDEDGNIQIRIG